MLIYRVEHRVDNRGPYFYDTKDDNCLKLCMELVSNHSNPVSHPTGLRDEVGTLSYDDRYGFDSLESLYRWFDGFIFKLKQNNYVIKVFESNKFRYGKSKKQLVFHRDEPIQILELEESKSV